MVSAIGSSQYSSPVDSGPSIAGLEAKLARLQKVLSECVSCSSAKTHEGQEAIKEVSCQIGDIKARIEKATLERSSTQPAGQNSANTSANRDDATIPVAGHATATLGTRLNVFA